MGEAVRISHVADTLAGLWHAPLTAPAALAVLSHGSGDSVETRTTITMEGEASWLRDQGCAVLVPMRRVRGVSDGVYGETKCCALDTYALCDRSARLWEAVVDLRAAIGFGLQQPGVRPGPVLTAGQCGGGFLSIAYAGLHPAEVSGVISFVGGWARQATRIVLTPRATSRSVGLLRDEGIHCRTRPRSFLSAPASIR